MFQDTSQALRIAIFASSVLIAISPAHAGASYLGVAPQGNAAKGADNIAVCSSCHGAHGNSLKPEFPNLAGQNYNYLLKQMENFRSGARQNNTMSAMIQTVPKAPGDANLQDIARYFSSQPLDRKANANATAAKAPLTLANEGYRIYQQGIPAQRVPSCSACHMPSGLGNAPMAIPALAGQHATYIEAQLKLFATGKRDNSPGHVMEMIARRLRPGQRHAVAVYSEALDPSLINGIGPRDYAEYIKALASQKVPGVPTAALATEAATDSKKTGAGN